MLIKENKNYCNLEMHLDIEKFRHTWGKLWVSPGTGLRKLYFGGV